MIIFAFGCVFLIKLVFSQLRRHARSAIKVAKDAAGCNHLVALLRASSDTGVMGFDCEWTYDDKNRRRPVALLQLSSHNGLCGLFRLNMQGDMPHDLKTLLEDPSVLKVGVAPLVDAAYLLQDRGVTVKGCLDLRHLSGNEAGLAALAMSHLDIVLDKDKAVRCSDWEADVLSARQVEYAALDALVALKIFWALVGDGNIVDMCDRFVDMPYNGQPMSYTPTIKSSSSIPRICPPSKLETIKMPLYEGISIQKPDGSTLVTCSARKANWYLERDLATQVCENPLTIRLKFEPRMGHHDERAEDTLFYKEVRDNHCVACGSTTSLRRKHIVPQEYRKHFPVEIKSHLSHDVLLMCTTCHAETTQHDNSLREHLVELCQAPLAIPFVVVPEIYKLRTAARTLLAPSEVSQTQLQECHSIIVDYIEQLNYDNAVLADIAALKPRILDETFVQHGQKVVEYYQRKFGGVFPLQEVWRQHFLDTTKPRFLPKYWSTYHGMTGDQKEILDNLLIW